jgi:hypothetical protein
VAPISDRSNETRAQDANTVGVDFYLVDLRDATYNPDQEEWFRRCGAILVDPAP